VVSLKKQTHLKKIVVYHTGALGDLLVSTAALKWAISLFPESVQWTVVGNGLWKQILLPSQWPQIKSILQIEPRNQQKNVLWHASESKNEWTASKPQFDLSLKQFLHSFDLSIDFRSESLRFALQAMWAGVPVRVGASKSRLAKIFFTHFVLEKNTQVTHERDRYLNILSSLDEKSEIKPDFIGLPQLKKFDQAFFLESTGMPLKTIVLINPTASKRQKAWPSQRFRQLALELHKKGHSVQIIGSPSETEWLSEVAQKDFSVLQPKSILNLVDLVFGAKILITNTSSMQFIAAGTNTPVATLVGSANPLVWGPLGTSALYIKASGSDVQDEEKAYGKISVEMVLSKLEDFLG